MQITKEFRIYEVRAARVSNTPFKIVLEGNPFKRDEESSLVLDSDTCARYNIPMSLNIVGRTLVCLFESRELLLKNGGHSREQVDMESLGNDDLAIQSLKRNETMSPSFGTVSPSKHYGTSRTLKLLSFGGGDGIHPHIMPCPFYCFALELTEEEYEACNALPATVVFKASFRLTASRE